MKHALLIAALASTLSCVSIPALAAGGGGDSMKAAVDPVVEKANEAIDKGDWTGAQAVLRNALASNPKNADYHNLYAYSLRKGPNPDMSAVFQHYNEALRIDPKHRGAHEYLGEAYLMVGNVEKAKEHLAQLDKICFLPCSEHKQLKAAIAAYQPGAMPVRSSETR